MVPAPPPPIPAPADAGEPTPPDLSKEFYTAARAELVERLRLRDNLLVVYFTATATLIGATLTRLIGTEALLAIPYFALGVAILVGQHNLIVEGLGRFLVAEINPGTNSTGSPRRHWDSSEAFKKIRAAAVTLRLVGESVMLHTPCIIALAANGRHALGSPFPYGPAWWVSLLCAVGTVVPGVAVWIRRLRAREFQ